MNQILGGIMATQQIEDPVKRKIAEYALITVSIWIMVVGIYFFNVSRITFFWRQLPAFRPWSAD